MDIVHLNFMLLSYVCLKDLSQFRIKGFDQMKCCLIVFVFLSFFAALSTATFNSDGILGSHVSSERRLLQAKTPCPINFEIQNYTIITSKCTGPKYSIDLCCSSFKDFACPFVDILNDLTNDCAINMFTYINLKGQYPQGLFASLCREGKEGLTCPAAPPSSVEAEEATGKNGGLSVFELLPKLRLMALSFMLSMQFI